MTTMNMRSCFFDAWKHQAQGLRIILVLGSFICLYRQALADDERIYSFGDPFIQITQGLTECAMQQPSRFTKAEMLAQAHYRVERGTSCYQSGQCRLPNSYLYDKEIIPRVQKALLADGRFLNTNVAVEGQRRWVTLKGCVQTQEQASSIEQLVRTIDDVEAVINQLQIIGK